MLAFPEAGAALYLTRVRVCRQYAHKLTVDNLGLLKFANEGALDAKKFKQYMEGMATFIKTEQARMAREAAAETEQVVDL